MKKIYNMLLLAALTMTLFSCSNWESPYYVDDIVGGWISYYGHDAYGEYDIVGYDQVRYDFYRNYTGRYTYYSRYGMDYLDFDWDTHGDRLIIHYEDGTSEYLYYGYDRNGDLIMATDSRFYQYTAYRPVGMYYDKAKDMSMMAPKRAGTTVDKAATAPQGPRATKSREARTEK
jgi:hypothetical protein